MVKWIVLGVVLLGLLVLAVAAQPLLGRMRRLDRAQRRLRRRLAEAEALQAEAAALQERVLVLQERAAVLQDDPPPWATSLSARMRRSARRFDGWVAYAQARAAEAAAAGRS